MVQWIRWNAEDFAVESKYSPLSSHRSVWQNNVPPLTDVAQCSSERRKKPLRYQYWNFKIVVLQNPRLCWKQDPQRKIWLQQWLILELMELPHFVSKFTSSFLAWDVIPQNWRNRVEMLRSCFSLCHLIMICYQRFRSAILTQWLYECLQLVTFLINQCHTWSLEKSKALWIYLWLMRTWRHFCTWQKY